MHLAPTVPNGVISNINPESPHPNKYSGKSSSKSIIFKTDPGTHWSYGKESLQIPLNRKASNTTSNGSVSVRSCLTYKRSAIQTSVYLMTRSTPTQQAHQEKCLFLKLLQFPSNPFWIPEQKWCCKATETKKKCWQRRYKYTTKNSGAGFKATAAIGAPDLGGPVSCNRLESSFTPEKSHRTLSIDCLIHTLNAKHTLQQR